MNPRVRAVFIAGDDDADVIFKPFCNHCRRYAQYASGIKKWMCPSCFDDLTPPKEEKTLKKQKRNPQIVQAGKKKSRYNDPELPAGAYWIGDEYDEDQPQTLTHYPASNRTE